MDLAKVAEAQRAWRQVAAAGGITAERAAAEAWARCGDSIAALARNLGQIGYPCTRLVQPCAPNLDQRVQEVEEAIGSAIPPVVKALWRTVGGLSLVDLGTYEHVEFWEDQGVFGPEGYCDGVYVDACTAEWADFISEELLEREYSADEESEFPFLISLSPDGYHKDNVSGGAPYGVYSGVTWVPVWENFAWSGYVRPETAPPDPPDFLAYVLTALLECAGFPALLGADGFQEVKERLLEGVPIF